MMVRDFQAVVGIEAREQFLEMTGELPDAVVACVGGGSNAMGTLPGSSTTRWRSTAWNRWAGGSALGDHAASLSYGSEGIMHGFNSIMLKDTNGIRRRSTPWPAGWTIPPPDRSTPSCTIWDGSEYDVVNDEETIDAFFTLSRLEGIIPAIESAHAVAYGMKLARTMGKGSVLINLSGRGDKDMDYILKNTGSGKRIRTGERRSAWALPRFAGGRGRTFTPVKSPHRRKRRRQFQAAGPERPGPPGWSRPW